MNPAPESAAKMQKDASLRLRGIPSVDELLGRPRLLALAEQSGRALVTQAVRDVLAQLRVQLKADPALPNDPGTATFELQQLESRVIAEVERILAPSLRRVINATGVVLHTNLGRAPLSPAAVAQIAETATHYSNLEYDIPRG
ncbi:MAG TPA: hypothetical protein VJ228_04655, partial [Candidatus Acidoferrales bacterium]|nr:hypothetical protein [Candidatus Acidoferrales bacterium]